MAKGIVYCMTTVLPGIVKIGKTRTDQFESRMRYLEQNGYAQVGGLKRRFAIEVKDYDSKESLIHELFSKSRIQNTELFAVNEELVVQLLSSLDGTEVYPKSMSKDEVFSTATDEVAENHNGKDRTLVPNGVYVFKEVRKGKQLNAKMKVQKGKYIVLKGSTCLPVKGDWQPECRKNAIVKNEILEEDVECNSPSTAGWIVLGRATNGWEFWKNKDGKKIDIYRNKIEDDE